MAATAANNLKIVNALLKRNAALDTQSADYKTTALHIAGGSGFLDIVKVLLTAGADRAVKSIEGFTPAGLARHQGFANVADYIDQ